MIVNDVRSDPGQDFSRSQRVGVRHVMGVLRSQMQSHPNEDHPGRDNLFQSLVKFHDVRSGIVYESWRLVHKFILIVLP